MLIFVSSLRRYKRQLKRLQKKYRTALEQSVLLAEDIGRGARPGDAIPGFDGTVFKVRRINPAVRGGARKGYRFIYYLHAHDQATMLTVYSKSEQEDIADSEIAELLKDVEREISGE